MSGFMNDVALSHSDKGEKKAAFAISNDEAAEREKKRLEDLVAGGEHSLRAAVYSGHVRDVEFLIEHGVSADSAMWIACDNLEPKDAQEGILDVVKALIRLGNVDARDDKGKTLLMAIARRDKVSFAKELIRHGGDVNASGYNGWTPLMHAAMSDAANVAAVLLRHGADVNTKDDIGKTPLMYAIEWRAANVAAKLLCHGADVNAKDDYGKTPLMHAAKSDAADVAIQLIQLGADVNAKDNNGETPLMHAAKSDAANVAADLLRHGADVNAMGRTGLTAWKNAVNHRSKEVVSAIFRHSSSGHPSPSDDEADLCIAAVWGDVVSLRALVERGVGLEFASHQGKTALFFAVEYQRTEAALLLIASGACVDVKVHPSPHSKYATPLLIAGHTGQMQVFKALVQAGAPVNVCSSVDGETPLISAARFGDFPAVPLLITHGGSALRVEDVGDDECPLLPGSLEMMTTMCALIAFEYEPMCTRMIARLLIVCCELQRQAFVQQSPTDLTAAEPTAASAAQHQSDVLMAFARILYRACRLLFDIEGKISTLSRFIASRAIVRRFQDIDDELDSFARMQNLDVLETFASALRGQQASSNELESLTQQLQQCFEQALSSDGALAVRHKEDRINTAVLLKYELLLLQREQRQETHAMIVEQVLTRFLRVCNIEKGLDVPVWFISRDDLEFHSWNSVNTGNDLMRYEGTWRGTRVTIDRSDPFAKGFMAAADKWYSLKHPNIVELFGACHISSTKYFVYKSIRDGLPLHEFLRKSETNRARTWQCLYEAALGLQYMHNHDIVHGCLRSGTIVVGSDMVARLNKIGINRTVFHSDDRDYKCFIAPELKLVLSTAMGNVYAFGICIMEALTLQSPRAGITDEDVKVIQKSGKLPDRPANIGDAEWTLINDMCAKDPSKRVSIAHVVNRLKLFKQEHEQTHSSCSIGDNTDRTSSNADSHSKSQQRVDEHRFVELDGMTIPSTLALVTSRCEDLSDAQWISVRVLPALDFAFRLLCERNKMLDDPEVLAFCNLLARLWRYVRTAVSSKSMYQRMRSRKVAESHRLVYIELDRLLDELHVPVDDAIRAWRLEIASSIIGPAYTTNANDTTDRTSDDSSHPSLTTEVVSGPITLSLLDTSPVSHKQWTRDGLAKATESDALWRPPWYLSLRDLVFSDADKIGQGSFGAVYKGRWHDALVVIKFMGYENDIETISTDLLLHEVRVWHRLNHPHVLKFYGASHVDKRYFVCELAGNGELSSYLKQRGNEHFVWQKLHEAALGLKYLHDSGVVHNDLKGDNIMVHLDGSAKLIDFGMSALLGEAEIQVAKQSISAVNWRSPEYLAGGRPSRSSDVYSFAMCIIEAVSGKIPWENEILPATLKYQWKRGNTAPLPASMNAKQRNLIERMTTLDPAGRLSMGIVVNTLNEIALDERAMHAP